MRVTGVRRNRFVEFEFSIDDDLTVEMIMPLAEFRIFRDERRATMLPMTEEAALAYLELCRLHDPNPIQGQPIQQNQPNEQERCRE